MRKLSILCLFIALFTTNTFGQAEEATLLGIWTEEDLVGSSAHGNIYNEIWGYATNGHEYAIIGSTAGTHLIDVTQPTEPFEAFFIEGVVNSPAIIHRDYHDYRGFLYAAAGEGSSSALQIIDLRQLPDKIEVVYSDNTIFRTAHNIFIDTSQAKLYALTARGNNNGYAPMRVFDLSNPKNPIELGSYSEFGGIFPSHVHDAFIEDNIAFLNLGNDGLAIVDLSIVNEPQVISTVTDYPSRGYNHSGWVSTDCSTYYFADENHGFDLKVLDISNLCEPEVIGTFDAQVSNESSITHNQLVACNYLYVSYYYDGLRVYDIADPQKPVLVRYYDTYPRPNKTRYEGAWGVYPFLPSGNILVSDMQFGLHVFEGMGDNCSSQPRTNSCLQNQNCNTTSIDVLSSVNEMLVAPNPAMDRISLFINLNSAIDNLTVSLQSLGGQEIKHWAFQDVGVGQNDFSILLPNSLNAGVYFLSLRSEKFQVMQKLVIGH